MARLDKVRGFNYNMSETVHCVTATQMDLVPKKRKHFLGTNRTNTMGPLAFAPFTDENHLMLKWKDKKECFSLAARASCKIGGAAPEHAEKTVQKPETIEPLTYHSLSDKFWDEMIHSQCATGIFDYTVGPGYLAESAIANKLLYFGVVHTEKHASVVKTYLIKRVWKMMQTEGHEYYEPGLVELLAKGSEPDAGKDASGSIPSAATSKAELKAKAKGKAKAKAAAAGGRRVDLTEDDLKKRLAELSAAAAEGQEEPADSESANEDVREE